jgi:hypothetical protein
VVSGLSRVLDTQLEPFLSSEYYVVPYQQSAYSYRLLSCSTATAGSDGSLAVTWTTGEPKVSFSSRQGTRLIRQVYVSSDVAAGGGFCGVTANTAVRTVYKMCGSIS